MPYERTVAEVLTAHAESVKDDVYVARPAFITAVHADTQTVDVVLGVKNPLFDEYGRATFEDPQSIADVPYGMMRASKFFIWIPPSVGDSVLCLFTDLSIDTWRAASDGKPVQPGWLGKHTADSCVAIPCVAPDASKFADISANADKIIIGIDGKPTQIVIDDSTVKLGQAASDSVALSAKIDALINVLVGAYTPSGTETGFATLITALTTFKTTYWTSSTTVASPVAKA